MRKKIVFAVVTAGALLGASSLAFAQQGLGNYPNDAAQQQLATQGTASGTYGSSTTGYSERSDRAVPPGWRRRPVEPITPRDR